MRLIDVNLLVPGMVLASPVYSYGGRVLLRETVVLTQAYVERIQKMNIQCVYIFDKLSSAIDVNTVIDRKHLMKAYSAMKKKNYDLCIAVASSIVNDIRSNVSRVPNMQQLQYFDNSTFNHSVRVAILSTLVGIELWLPEDKLDSIALAGMLHDIGKEKIPIDILRKQGELTGEEYSLIQKHTEFGYEIVRGNSLIPAVVKHAILYHHENEDGSGYPHHKKSKEINIIAKIIHVCDVYDAMVSKRSYKESFSPAYAREFLVKNVNIMFDPSVVSAFLTAVFPYATGMSVILSDGRTAIVSCNHKGSVSEPDVILSATGETIELRHTPGLFIVKAVNENQCANF